MASSHLQFSPSLNSNEIGLHLPRHVSEPVRARNCFSSAQFLFAERSRIDFGTESLHPARGGLVIHPRASTLQRVETSEEVEVRKSSVSRIDIRTLQGCGLGISWYPDFVYNAEGGGGTGTAEEVEDGQLLAVEFDADELLIPSLGYKTTTFLGLPLPPFIRIDVTPQDLKGVIERATGKVELQFSAKFLFSVGSLYRPPPLMVETRLTTELIQGSLRKGQGKRLDSHGECRLVGVAPVARIEDAFMNAFLNLPTECLANMAAKFNFSFTKVLSPP